MTIRPRQFPSQAVQDASSEYPHSSRKTQCDRILAVLVEANGAWVPCYELAALALQYAARVHALRKSGYRIENKVTIVDGRKHGSYRLILPEQTTAQATEPPHQPEASREDYAATMERRLHDKAMPLFAVPEDRS